MSVFYLDTSAALKLLSAEAHSFPLAEFYDDHAASTWVSSTLLQVELMRAVNRSAPVLIPVARELLQAFDYISIDRDIIAGAMDEPDRLLRSLDAIHLSTARALGSDLDGLVTYDERLAAAARPAGMTVVSPRDRNVKN